MTTATAPDILDAYPGLLALADRLKDVRGVDVLLDAIRSLLQQNHDLRADEGELRYFVQTTRHNGWCGAVSVEFADMKTALLAVEKLVAESRDSRHINHWQAYEIVAVRRLVVQTIRAEKEPLRKEWCPRCSGKGRRLNEARMDDCPTCNGTGVV